MESITSCAAVNYRSTLGIRGQNLYSKDTVLNHLSDMIIALGNKFCAAYLMKISQFG